MAKAQQKKEEIPTKTTEQPTKTPIQRQEGEFAFGLPRNNPFALMRRLTEEMEDMIAEFNLGRRFGSPFLRGEIFRPGFTWLEEPLFLTEGAELVNLWSPQVEVFQRKNQLVVRADLPGIKKEDVKIEIKDNLLAIYGERKQESEEKGEGFYRSELSYGNFYREIPLPKGAKTDNAKASFKDGVLEVAIEIPKLAEAGKRLEITED
jgi:HSP20 family protein